MRHDIRFLEPDDVELLIGLLDSFADAFDDSTTYRTKRPSRTYLRRLLGKPQLIALAARSGDKVIGGLVAYVLEKYEQERSEIYIYDLAVSASHRRQGIATALVDKLCDIGRKRGAYVIYVQADPGDQAATALYTKLGTREEVLHFDIKL